MVYIINDISAILPLYTLFISYKDLSFSFWLKYQSTHITCGSHRHADTSLVSPAHVWPVQDGVDASQHTLRAQFCAKPTMFVFSVLALLHCSGGLLSAGERAADSRVCALAGRRPLDHACDALFRYHMLLKLTLVSFVIVEVLNLKQIKNIHLKESEYHAESKILQELSYCCLSHGSYTRNNKAFFATMPQNNHFGFPENLSVTVLKRAISFLNVKNIL